MSAPATSRAANQERKGPPLSAVRMMGLSTAAALLGGQQALADALAIEPRSLRLKLSADRGVTNDDLLFAAAALDARAERLMDHAAKLRAEAGQSKKGEC
ncbi:MAG TPA: hypothetical protein DEP91_11530 [Sphingomonas bacterium]|uniref:Uncharacterized protein n=1 Tax=Sphingomonas bacterium TaxID=1895847 RepID=A0A3D0WDH6_9SPHN|nr:hypothetical protein [Sphingomonas bacterium]